MSYPGGKGAEGVAQTIINQQPPHDWYVEPFLGNGSVMRMKRPARNGNEGIDLDERALERFENDSRFASSSFQFHHGCGISFLEEVANGEFGLDTLLFCDPPYPFAVRLQQRRLYRYEMQDVDHRRLLTVLRRLSCMVQITSYWNPLYAAMLEDWRLVRFQGMTRGGPREECLWMNYPEPTELHDYRFLGTDFRERERIRRKAGRWASRFAALPALERLAVISAMRDLDDARSVPFTSGDGRRHASALSTVPAATGAYGDAAGVGDQL